MNTVPSTGDTLFPTFLPLLECFLERAFCDGAQFSYVSLCQTVGQSDNQIVSQLTCHGQLTSQ